MNILHHKSWHVYSKDNQEKVREAEAKQNEIIKVEKDEKAQTERVDLLTKLRKKAHLKGNQATQTTITENNTSYETNNYDLVETIQKEGEEGQEQEQEIHPTDSLDLQSVLVSKLNQELTHLEAKKNEVKVAPKLTNTFLVKPKEKVPWYNQRENLAEQETSNLHKEKLRRSLNYQDPLVSINKELKSREFRINPKIETKRIRNKGDEATPSDKDYNTIEHKRKLRLQRENLEREKVEQIFKQGRLEKEEIDISQFYTKKVKKSKKEKKEKKERRSNR